MELILKNWDSKSISLGGFTPLNNKAAQEKLSYFKVWFLLRFSLNKSADAYEIVNQLGLYTNAFWIFFIETYFIHKKLSIKLLTQKINQYFIFGQNMENVSMHRLGYFIPEELRKDFDKFFQSEFLSESEMIGLDNITLSSTESALPLQKIQTVYLDHFVIKNKNVTSVGVKFCQNGKCYFNKIEVSIKQLHNWLENGSQHILAQNALKFLIANANNQEENSYYFRVHYEQYLKIQSANICN